MSDIFHEINEELRADRARMMMRKYGGYILGAVAAIIILVGARQGYIHWQDGKRGALANQYRAALLSETPVADLMPLSEKSGGYGMLAGFQRAALLAETNKTEAEAVYLALADDASLKPLYQDIALILSVINAPENVSVDERVARLERISSLDNPWHGLRLEIMVGLSLEKGDLIAAKNYLEEMQNLSARLSPESNRRMQILATALAQ